MNNNNSKRFKFYIAGVICTILFVVAILLEWYFWSFVIGFAAYLLFCAGAVLKDMDKERKEYNDFYDISVFKIGMPMQEVVKLNSKYRLVKIADEKNAVPIDTCPSCGAKVTNGKCEYCGNTYTDNSGVSRLIYESRYGKRIFEFDENKRLINFKRWIEKSR